MKQELYNILEKASYLYKKYGIKSVTMDDIASELGISKKTLYQYVSEKTELVEKVINYDIDKRMTVLQKILKKPLNAIDQLFEVIKFVNNILKEYSSTTEYDLKKYYPALYKKIREVKLNNMYNTICYNIKKGKEEGLYRKDLNEEIIAKLHLSRIERIPDNSIFTIDEYISPKFFYEIFIYHIRGIANEKGLNILEKSLKKLEINDLSF